MSPSEQQGQSREPAPHPAVRARANAVTFWWRIGFIAYAMLITIATHWPALDIGSPTLPAADKIIHLYAFAVLVILLWRTRWVRSFFLLGAIGLTWVLLDEWTQSLPVLRREYSWQDVAASAAGVTTGWAWVVALWPVGGRANLHRLAMQRRVLDDLFASVTRRESIMAWALLAAAVVPPGVALLVVWPRIIVEFPNPVPGIVYGVAQAAWLGIVLVLWSRLWKRASAHASAERYCHACDASCLEVMDNGRGEAVCPVCGTIVHVGQWLPPVGPDGPTLRRMAFWPVAGALVAMVVMLTVGFAVAWETFGREMIRWPRDFTITIDLAVLLVAAAGGVLFYRARLARYHDNQHRACRACAHDLRGTPVAEGIGRCGECGTEFADYHDAEAGSADLHRR